VFYLRRNSIKLQENCVSPLLKVDTFLLVVELFVFHKVIFTIFKVFKTMKVNGNRIVKKHTIWFLPSRLTLRCITTSRSCSLISISTGSTNRSGTKIFFVQEATSICFCLSTIFFGAQ
jgi:hypothetical protein